MKFLARVPVIYNNKLRKDSSDQKNKSKVFLGQCIHSYWVLDTDNNWYFITNKLEKSPSITTLRACNIPALRCQFSYKALYHPPLLTFAIYKRHNPPFELFPTN
jgi:hypothetical protein